ncbi:MAG: hypothetical protein KAR08_05905 [Candidatus Heimdallarchaeota archaeon]|nr:hypothetical protein [Candidatus Heimdallarchaeota archaeon]
MEKKQLKEELKKLKLLLKDGTFLKSLSVKGFLYEFNMGSELNKLRNTIPMIEGIEEFRNQLLPKIDNRKGRGVFRGLKQELFDGGIYEGSVIVHPSETIVEYLTFIKVLLSKATTVEDVNTFIDEICEWGEIIIQDDVMGNHKLCKVMLYP